MNRLALIIALAATSTALVSCSSATPEAPAAPAASPTGSADTTTFLQEHGLDGLTGQQVVDKLDASEDDRTEGPSGSVRPTQVLLTDKDTGQEVGLPLQNDRFYLAMAPYEQTTHECFNHNTATCKGELVGKTFHVTLVDTTGKTVVDQDVTAYDNGFGAIWAPRDITGTLTVAYDGKTAVTPVSTGPDSPTCLTTPLKLT